MPETTIPRTLSGGYKPGTLSETIDRPVPESKCQTVGTRIRPEWLTFIRPSAAS